MPSLVISLRTSILYMVPREKLRVVINLKTDIFVRENVFYKIFEMSLIVDYDLIGTHFEAFVSKSPKEWNKV